MSAVHDFRRSLALSHSYAKADWWEACYKRAFPNLASCVEVRDDGWAQRAGIDRILTLSDGKVIKIDEKVRSVDYGDILLEVESVVERREAGWVSKPLDCDFIAYAVVPTQTCYLLPTLLLQKAWRDNRDEWWNMATERTGGFRLCDANNRTYTTRSIAVPTEKLLSSIAQSVVVKW